MRWRGADTLKPGDCYFLVVGAHSVLKTLCVFCSKNWCTSLNSIYTRTSLLFLNCCWTYSSLGDFLTACVLLRALPGAWFSPSSQAIFKLPAVFFFFFVVVLILGFNINSAGS